MSYVDTHCHLHSQEFFKRSEAEVILDESTQADVTKILCVGTSLADSQEAVKFARSHPGACWASVGIHPHEAVKLTAQEITDHLSSLSELATREKVIAIGECGFDFYYNKQFKARPRQLQLLEGQLQIALDNNLPVSFHVRDAFTAFWPVFQNFPGVRGVLHSFTDTQSELERALGHNLYIGVNGISTFTKLHWQQELFRTLPLENIVVETDTPFLTPKPHRGKINTPKSVIYITEYLAELRGEDELLIKQSTGRNAQRLLRW